MNKQQLIKAIAADAGITQTAARAALQAFEFRVTEALVNKEDVTLVGFGTFKAVERAEREGRNPKTGEAITIPAATVPRFAAGKGLKEAVNL